MRSILEDAGDERQCLMCGAIHELETHHVFGGPYRKKSERYGLTVTLCNSCHNQPPFGVHYDRKKMNRLKAFAQKKAMAAYGWDTEDFIAQFGRNYLEENYDR